MKWKKTIIVTWLLIIISVFIATIINHRPYLYMGGSSSVAPVMEQLLTKAPNNHKEVDFNYISSASSGALPRVKSKQFSIGWLSKEYKKSSQEKDLIVFKLMLDGLVIVYNLPDSFLVNPKEPLNFDIQKMLDLYIKKKSWNEVFKSEKVFKEGVKDIQVKTFTRPNGSGTRDVFDKMVLKNEKLYDANTVDSSSAMLNLDPGGIGYSSYADYSQSKNIVVKTGNWMGAIPTYENIKDQDKIDSYKLVRPFTGIINRNFNNVKPLKNLLRWIFDEKNDEVNNIFKKFGPRVELKDKDNEALKTWLNQDSIQRQK